VLFESVVDSTELRSWILVSAEPLLLPERFLSCGVSLIEFELAPVFIRRLFRFGLVVAASRVVAEFASVVEPVVAPPEVAGAVAESVAAGAAMLELVELPLAVSDVLGALALDEVVPEE